MVSTLSYFNAPSTPADGQSYLNVLVNTINAMNAGAGGQSVQTQNIIAAVIAGTQTKTSGTLSFADSNGITFGLSGSNTLTASIAAQTNQAVSGFAVSNTTLSTAHSIDIRSLSFAGAGGVSVGMSNGSVQISGAAFSAGMSNIANSAGTSGTVGGRVVYVGGNNITLSQSVNGQSATVSFVGAATAAQSNQTIGLFALGNTTNNSSTTFNATAISFSAVSGQTIGFNGGAVQVLSPPSVSTAQAVSCTATQTYTSNTTPADIPGISITVASGKTYVITALIMGSAGAGGTNVSIGGTAIIANLYGIGVSYSSASAPLSTNTFTSGTILGLATANWDHMYITMTIVVTTGGTITLQGCQNSSSGTSSFINIGSNLSAIMQ